MHARVISCQVRLFVEMQFFEVHSSAFYYSGALIFMCELYRRRNREHFAHGKEGGFLPCFGLDRLHGRDAPPRRLDGIYDLFKHNWYKSLD